MLEKRILAASTDEGMEILKEFVHSIWLIDKRLNFEYLEGRLGSCLIAAVEPLQFFYQM
jgi:hypothetical protein